MTQRIPWTRLLAEGALIVTSILLAFAIDAWWEGRGDRVREREAVAGIRQDFEGHMQVVRLNQERQTGRLDAASRLLESVGPAAAPADSSVENAIGVLALSAPVALQGGTLEALVNTTGLSLLGDPALQTELLRWLQATEDLASVNQFVQEEFSNAVYQQHYASTVMLSRLARLAEVAESVLRLVES